MSDESQLRQDAARAPRAQSLLDNELLAGAFKGLEEAYTSAWRATLIDDVAAREKLAAIVNNGKLAQAELKQLAETAERKRRFGIL